MLQLAGLKPTEVATVLISLSAFVFSVVAFVLNRRYTDRQFRELNYPDLDFELSGYIRSSATLLPAGVNVLVPHIAMEVHHELDVPLFETRWRNLGSGNAVDVTVVLDFAPFGKWLQTTTRLPNIEPMSSGRRLVDLGVAQRLAREFPAHASVRTVSPSNEVRCEREILVVVPSDMSFDAVATLSWRAAHIGSRHSHKRLRINICAVGSERVEYWSVTTRAWHERLAFWRHAS